MSDDQLKASRAILWWAVTHHRMRWCEYNRLIEDVVAQERCISGCAGKEAFSTFEMAQRVADRPCRDGHVHRKAYRCERCHQWHLATLHPQARTITAKYRAKKLEAAYG